MPTPTPLCPAGRSSLQSIHRIDCSASRTAPHPPQGGRSPSREATGQNYPSADERSEKDRAPRHLLISPLVGAMPGKAEGGTGTDIQTHAALKLAAEIRQPLPLIRLPAPSPRARGEGSCGTAAAPSPFSPSERGEGPGRGMRGRRHTAAPLMVRCERSGLPFACDALAGRRAVWCPPLSCRTSPPQGGRPP
jgi:hypothetical protein